MLIRIVLISFSNWAIKVKISYKYSQGVSTIVGLNLPINVLDVLFLNMLSKTLIDLAYSP